MSESYKRSSRIQVNKFYYNVSLTINSETSEFIS